MMDSFNTRELTRFENELLRIAQRDMPRESRIFMNKQGRSLKKRTVAIARMNTGEKTGKYIKSIKKGKVYTRNSALCVRTYSYAPHAHLIEYGHRQVVNPSVGGKIKKGKGIGEEVGFVRGRYVFEDAAALYKGEFFTETQKFIDDVLDKGLS